VSEEGIGLPGHERGNYHIYHQYTIRHPRRDALQEFLKAHDVDSEIYYPLPLHLQPAYGVLGHRRGDFPVAEEACETVLSLPLFARMSDEQVGAVTSGVREFFERGR